jgi:hypothetical protein
MRGLSEFCTIFRIEYGRSQKPEGPLEGIPGFHAPSGVQRTPNQAARQGTACAAATGQ